MPRTEKSQFAIYCLIQACNDKAE